jgi:hypothetical protein
MDHDRRRVGDNDMIELDQLSKLSTKIDALGNKSGKVNK